MATTATQIILGAPAADFRLPATDGRTYTLDDRADENGAVNVFICNHCPYVKAVIDRLVADARVLMRGGDRFRVDLLQRRRGLSGGLFQRDEAMLRRTPSPFPIFMTRRSPWRGPMAPSARLISSAMIETASSNARGRLDEAASAASGTPSMLLGTAIWSIHARP